MKRPVFLDGERIYLSPLDMDDLETFIQWFNNPELRKYLAMYYPLSKLEEKDYLENLLGDKTKDNVILEIIVKNETEMKLIGVIGLHQINRVHRSAMLGVVIGDFGEQDKGYGPEAIALMVEYGFNTLNLHRIELFVHEYNSRALRAYRKLGFVEEGKTREAFYTKGDYHNQIIMAILKYEWRARAEN